VKSTNWDTRSPRVALFTGTDLFRTTASKPDPGSPSVNAPVQPGHSSRRHCKYSLTNAIADLPCSEKLDDETFENVSRNQKYFFDGRANLVYGINTGNGNIFTKM